VRWFFRQTQESSGTCRVSYRVIRKSRFREVVITARLRDACGGREVQVRVERAAWIEGRAAARAGLGRDVLGDAHGRAAHPAERGGHVVPAARDHLERVVGDGRVAQVARVPGVAARGAEGDNVEGGSVVDAARLVVDGRAEDHDRPLVDAFGLVHGRTPVAGVVRSDGGASWRA
jgi:hypothetical protein